MPPNSKRQSNTGRPFSALIVIALLVPGLLFATAAWRDHSALNRITESDALKLMVVFHGQAESLFRDNARVLDAVVNRVRDSDWPVMPRSPELLHDLEIIHTTLDDRPTILLVDADGVTRLAGVHRQDDQALPPGDTTCFLALQQGGLRTCIGRPTLDPLSGKPVFSLSRRLERNGVFSGMVQVAMSVDRMVHLWPSVLPHTTDTVSIVRRDGTVLARAVLPASADAVLRERSAATDSGSDVPSTTIISKAATSNPDDKITISRPIADFPADIVLGLDRNAIRAAWHRDIVIYALAAFSASAAIVLALGAAARRVRAERFATAGWRAEMQQREAAQEQLLQSQKMESLGKLISGFAHDFNNLLTVMIGNLGMIEHSMLDPKRKRQLQNALKAADTANQLTQQLLAFARKQVPQRRSIDLRELVEGVEELLVRALRKDIQLQIRADPALWSVQADSTQLELMLLNLTINARDAMPGGGTLLVDLRNEAFSYHAPEDLPPGQYVVLTVADNGVGMDAATLSRATEAFFTTKGPGKGTGLGLSMMQAAVAQVGGSTRLRSSPGKGTTVEVWLPRNQAAPAAATTSAQTGVAGSSGQSILVHDDIAAVLEVGDDALKEHGYQVTAAPTGLSALAAMCDEPLAGHLVLDVAVPDGVSVASQARANLPHLPVPPATSHAELDVVTTTVKGMPLLRKPFSQDQLSQDQLSRRIRCLLQGKPAAVDQVTSQQSPPLGDFLLSDG